MKPIYILGTGLSHDGSSCLMKDGEIVIAIEKERLTRIKHDGYNDNDTIKYCLDKAGITFEDLTMIVQKNTVNMKHDADSEIKKGGRHIPSDIPIYTISHHLAHAYSCIGMSPFMDEMGVIVMDGRGASYNNCIDNHFKSGQNLEISKNGEDYYEKESYYSYSDGKLMPIFKDYSLCLEQNRYEFPFAPNDMLHSIAELYGAVSQYIFADDNTEGKMMGLAPYGNPKVYTDEIFIKKDNKVYINYEVMKKFDYRKRGEKGTLFENFSYFADIATWIQNQTEDAVEYLFNSYYNLYPNDNVCFCGGLALNAVINSKLKSNTKFNNFYFQPAASDSGLALGCCYYGWLEILKKKKKVFNNSIYLGYEYLDDEIKSTLNKYSEQVIYSKEKHFVNQIVDALCEGKVVSLFQGGSEFGPRALGHRSLIANPALKYMKDHINIKIKKREDFRPFAPSVIEERFKDFFDSDYDESPYMINVSKVKEKFREKLPAITHIDDSARVQTVNKKNSPVYHEILTKFGDKTGIPVLLNTSMNNQGMPIVETPEEAITFFIENEIDVLLINDYIILKKP